MSGGGRPTRVRDPRLAHRGRPHGPLPTESSSSLLLFLPSSSPAHTLSFFPWMRWMSLRLVILPSKAGARRGPRRSGRFHILKIHLDFFSCSPPFFSFTRDEWRKEIVLSSGFIPPSSKRVDIENTSVIYEWRYYMSRQRIYIKNRNGKKWLVSATTRA